MREPGFPAADELRRAAWRRLWARLLQPPDTTVEPSPGGEDPVVDQGQIEPAGEGDASVEARPGGQHRTGMETGHQDAA